MKIQLQGEAGSEDEEGTQMCVFDLIEGSGGLSSGLNWRYDACLEQSITHPAHLRRSSEVRVWVEESLRDLIWHRENQGSPRAPLGNLLVLLPTFEDNKRL
jgi:hypothetical protein